MKYKVSLGLNFPSSATAWKKPKSTFFWFGLSGFTQVIIFKPFPGSQQVDWLRALILWDTRSHAILENSLGHQVSCHFRKRGNICHPALNRLKEIGNKLMEGVFNNPPPPWQFYHFYMSLFTYLKERTEIESKVESIVSSVYF